MLLLLFWAQWGLLCMAQTPEELRQAQQVAYYCRAFAQIRDSWNLVSFCDIYDPTLTFDVDGSISEMYSCVLAFL
jgi:hypothetical protein